MPGTLYERGAIAAIRRRRRAADDVAALIRALGGDEAVLGFYDARRNVTVVSGAVSQWDDARGDGFGPPLAQATTSARPTISGGRLAFDGTAQYLRTTSGISGLNAATDFGVSIGSTMPVGSTKVLVDFAPSAAISLFTSTGSALETYADSIRAIDPVVTSSEPGLRSVHARRAISGANITAGYQNGLASEVTTTGAATASAPGVLTVGANRSATPTGFAAASIGYLIVLLGTVTAGQRSAINSWASARWGATL